MTTRRACLAVYLLAVAAAATLNAHDAGAPLASGALGAVARWLPHPPGLLVAWTVVCAVGLVALSVHGLTGVRTDGQRLFTQTERREIFGRAGGRCEHKAPLWLRCREPASHADHVYPWSRGGDTCLSNAQALCARHNLRKSNHVPSPVYVWRLARRRRRYFPAGAPTRVRRRRASAPGQ